MSQASHMATHWGNYAVTTTDGTAATALVSLSSNRNYSSGMSLPGGPKPLEIRERAVLL